jgi:hypothetical protein
MDVATYKIEKYFLEQKDPKEIYKNLNDLNPKDIKEIVIFKNVNQSLKVNTLNQ